MAKDKYVPSKLFTNDSNVVELDESIVESMYLELETYMYASSLIFVRGHIRVR